MRLLLRFPCLVLQIFAGLLTAYGTFAMSTTGGIQPTNPVVLLGLIAVVASGLAAARVAGHSFAGWWPPLAALAVPWLLVTFPILLETPCPSDHPPLTPTYHCVPPGAPIFFAMSAIAIAVALWGARRDLQLSYGTAHRLDRAGRAET